MKDLIVGAYTNYNWDVIKYWANSIVRSGFDGHKAMIVMNSDKETVDKLTDLGFSILALGRDNKGNFTHGQQSRFPVHVERFFHIWRLLQNIEEPVRYVITTDVKDVVFQRNPSEFISRKMMEKPNAKLIIGSEGMAYQDEPWGNNNLKEAFGPFFHNLYKEYEIYNVGVIAGESQYVKDLCLNIFQMSINRPTPIVDQAVFNFLMWQAPWRDITLRMAADSDFACHAGTLVDPTKIEKFRKNLLAKEPVFDGENVYNGTLGLPYTIVHQWDRVPAWKDMIERKYG